MDSEKPLRGKILLATAGLALFLIVMGLALKMNGIATTPAMADEPLKSVAFADGGTFEVIGVSVGERVVEIVPAKRFKMPFFTSKGSSGGVYGGLQIRTEKESGKVIRTSVRSDTPGAMLMEFRVKDRSGTGLKLPSHLTRSNFVFQDDRIGTKRAPHHQFSPKDDRVETVVDAMMKVNLQVLIQHRDPQAGWIHLNGPSMFHEPWPDRYMVALDAWQRNLPDLDFRAIRADGKVVEFSLPNPDFRKSPAAGTAASIPLVHNGGDYTLTVRQVEKFGGAGDHPFAGVEMDFQLRGGRGEGEFGASTTLRGGTAEDEWGNRVVFEQKSIRKKIRFGAHLPATSKRMKAQLTVVRTANCPRQDYTGFIVLEGVVAADGLSVTFTPGPDAPVLGVGKMPVVSIMPNASKWGDAATKDWKLLEFGISGEGGKTATIEKRIGDIFNAQFLFFPEGSNESAGIIPMAPGGGGGQGGGIFNFQQEITWLGSPEMLRPGAKIRVGVFRPAKNDDLKFDLELPELVQPR